MTDNNFSMLMTNMKKVIVGKDEVIEKLMVCLLSRGHVLIEDVPGVGKTTMVKTLSKTLDLSFNRVQFTPDLMPSDVTGFTMLSKATDAFVFKKGAIFCNILLADEINRTSPKTQSSLLQAMEELEVSADETTFKIEKPFLVLATQNPIEYQGTFPLPEAQLDRFLMKISIGYPDLASEIDIVKNYKISKTLEGIDTVLCKEDVLTMQEQVDQVFVSEDILRYIVKIVGVTRDDDEIKLGVSPRASIDLFRSSKALAYVRGRDFVIPDDVKELVPYVLNHRLILTSEAKMDGRTPDDVIEKVLKKVYVPVVSASDKK